MSLKIVRNDITKMNTDAIVNTANTNPVVGSGCDYAIYSAAGYDELLDYRKKEIGIVPEGDAFITPGFHLSAKYIIHAVSPCYQGGDEGEEEKLRSCYRKSLKLAADYEIKSIAFPLISTGSFGYPKEEGLRIAVDEINGFLLSYDLEVYLVVFGDKATRLGEKIFPDLKSYVDKTYVSERIDEEYFGEQNRRYANSRLDPTDEDQFHAESMPLIGARPMMASPMLSEAKPKSSMLKPSLPKPSKLFGSGAKSKKKNAEKIDESEDEILFMSAYSTRLVCAEETDGATDSDDAEFDDADFDDFIEEHERKLKERMSHLTDTFSQYLQFLIKEKNMSNVDVYKRAIVDKKTFSKIKKNVNYHPQKTTALCLCIGAKLNLDETKDLLARAGYALSPCDKTDIIFSYFIENEIYDMIELDIQLEEFGLPCLIQ